jgi:hypothetical protein
MLWKATVSFRPCEAVKQEKPACRPWKWANVYDINRVVPRHAAHVVQPSVGKMLLMLQSVLAISLTIRVPGNCAVDSVKSSGNSGSGNPSVATSHLAEQAKETCVQANAVCTSVLPAVRYVAALTLTGHRAHML